MNYKTIIKYIILIIVIILLILFINLSSKNLINFGINLFKTKIKVKGVKNLKYINNKKFIIMSNHLTGLDYFVITCTLNHYINYKKKIHTIVKHNLFGDETDKNSISNILSYFNKYLFNLLNFIPYIRQDKDSGEKVKQNILKILNQNNTILLFPEGQPTRKGVPKEFKSGSFRLCAENNIWILPVTLRFNKPIGVNKEDPIKLNDWFNVISTITIHKPIFNKDWEKLKKETFDVITKEL